MILYFNTKLTFDDISKNPIDSLTAITPIPFPKNNIDNIDLSKISILIQTLISYSKIEFEYCVFNIELDSHFSDNTDEIKKTIKKYFSNVNYELNFKRPENLFEWKKSIESLRRRFNQDIQILLCQNHDHVFVDYQVFCFKEVMNEIFEDSTGNFGKCFIYSHTPTFSSYCLNGIKAGVFNFKHFKNNIYKTKNVKTYFDSIVVLTLKTLSHVVENINYEGEYIGRFDWPNLYYKKLNICYYVYPREFFKHFDGYYNESGLRILSDLSEPASLKPYNKSPEFYYQKYIDTYIYVIRDSIIYKKLFQKTNTVYKNALIDTYNLFINIYLKNDLKNHIINDEEYVLILNSVKHKIFYNYNNIYCHLLPEIILKSTSLKYKLKIIYINNFKNSFIVNLLKKLLPSSLNKFIKSKYIKI